MLPPRLAVMLQFYRFHRKLLHLRHPRTFSEKVQRRKLYDRDPRFSLRADKVVVKDHARSVLGDDWIIPTLWSGTELPPRQARIWPTPFVIKANHASGWNRFIHGPEDLDWPAIEAECASWLRTPWFPEMHEPFYNDIPRQLLVEPLIGLPSGLMDYKFFVFAGRAEYIQVDIDRYGHHKRNFYNRDWELQNLAVRYERDLRGVERPAHLAEMISAAERIGGEFDFARIDFYDLPDGPKFGEITFTPESGRSRFVPAEMDGKFGALWPEPATRQIPPARSP
jgi:TupA-like ATPgrasp